MSQITRLHQKMRELKAVDEQLTAMKQDYANRMRVVGQGESRFLEKQKQTIEYLTKFRGYIQDADAKRSRAEKKMEDERRAIQEKRSEADALKARLAYLTKALKSKLRRLEHHRQFREYLESVVSVAKLVYGDVEDMISRHKSLTSTNKDLEARGAELQLEVSRLSAQRNAVRKEKQTELLVANSLLARLLKELESESARRAAQQAQVAAAETHAAATTRATGEIVMVVRNLHNQAVTGYPCVLQLQRRPLLTKPPPSSSLGLSIGVAAGQAKAAAAALAAAPAAAAAAAAAASAAPSAGDGAAQSGLSPSSTALTVGGFDGAGAGTLTVAGPSAASSNSGAGGATATALSAAVSAAAVADAAAEADAAALVAHIAELLDAVAETVNDAEFVLAELLRAPQQQQQQGLQQGPAAPALAPAMAPSAGVTGAAGPASGAPGANGATRAPRRGAKSASSAGRGGDAGGGSGGGSSGVAGAASGGDAGEWVSVPSSAAATAAAVAAAGLLGPSLSSFSGEVNLAAKFDANYRSPAAQATAAPAPAPALAPSAGATGPSGASFHGHTVGGSGPGGALPGVLPRVPGAGSAAGRTSAQRAARAGSAGAVGSSAASAAAARRPLVAAPPAAPLNRKEAWAAAAAGAAPPSPPQAPKKKLSAMNAAAIGRQPLRQ
jgi:hypothetical protein